MKNIWALFFHLQDSALIASTITHMHRATLLYQTPKRSNLLLIWSWYVSTYQDQMCVQMASPATRGSVCRNLSSSSHSGEVGLWDLSSRLRQWQVHCRLTVAGSVLIDCGRLSADWSWQVQYKMTMAGSEQIDWGRFNVYSCISQYRLTWQVQCLFITEPTLNLEALPS